MTADEARKQIDEALAFTLDKLGDSEVTDVKVTWSSEAGVRVTVEAEHGAE